MSTLDLEYYEKKRTQHRVEPNNKAVPGGHIRFHALLAVVQLPATETHLAAIIFS